MFSNRTAAAIFALVSVIFFTVSSHLTKLLVDDNFVTIIMAWRTLLAAAVMGIIALFERSFSFLIFGCRPFWCWLLMFVVTILLYGLAFASRSVDDVLIIAALMPLIVMLVDFGANPKNMQWAALPVVFCMFVAALTPSVYGFWIGKAELAPSWGTVFAAGATVCHAAWIILGRTVQKQSPPETKAAARLTVMLTLAGVALLALIALNIPQWFEEVLRHRNFRPSFWHWAEFWDVWKLAGAGVFAGLSPFFIVLAIKRDHPGRVIPYHYTLAIWTFVLTLLLAPERYTSDTLKVAATSAAIIGLGAGILFWLARDRPSASEGN
jgi:drug/metabolite transporter (DMT)-like permease